MQSQPYTVRTGSRGSRPKVGSETYQIAKEQALDW